MKTWKVKEIIDKWLEKNVNSYQLLFDKISAKENQKKWDIKNEENEGLKDEQELLLSGKIEKFVQQYAEPERFFVTEALKRNPAFMDISGTIENLMDDLWKICNDNKNRDDIQYIYFITKEKKVQNLRKKIKEKRLSVNSNFEKWIEEEFDTSVLTSLCVLLSLKIYDRSEAFARQMLLLDNKYWNLWRECRKYAFNM